MWPDLDYGAWRETASTLKLWLQIVGKTRLALTPWLNHSWRVPLYVTARGLHTSTIPFDGELLDVEFDFIEHRLRCRTSAGRAKAIILAPMTVAAFHREFTEALKALGVQVEITPTPSEIASPVAFEKDLFS